MVEITGVGIKVIINLEKGVYSAGVNSSTGKTYLYNVINAFARNIAVAISYSDVERGINPAELIEKIQPEIVLFDRYDMYAGKYDNLIRDIADKTIVIIDYKLESSLRDIMREAEFIISAGKIEVVTYDDF